MPTTQTSPELLKACFLSGQMSAAQYFAHVEAGEMEPIAGTTASAGSDRFDGAVVWRTLGAADKAAIGALTLEIFCAWFASEVDSDPVCGIETPVQRAAQAATNILLPRLQCAVVDAMPRALLQTKDGTPRLPSMMGSVCRVCGCSERDACFPACAWVEPDLCSGCKKEAA